MGIDVYVAKSEQDTWHKEPEFYDHNHDLAIEKLSARVYRRDEYSLLRRIDPYDKVVFNHDELHLLHEELRTYREHLNTKELEEPKSNIGWKKYYIYTEIPEKFYIISIEERDAISKLIKVVEENLGNPDMGIIFMGD